LPEFKSHFKLIVPDLRGHGRSSFTEENFTHRLAAKDILALLDHLGISSTSAIGNSTGAMTLLHVATIAPQRVKSMVLNSKAEKVPPIIRIDRSVKN
jgi:pimeloyl-ACP methyl ester carboxylesterase